MNAQISQEAKVLWIPIAMMMAVVATLGAVVAYRAALAEHETLRSERRLQQGKMLEYVYRQDSLSKVSNYTKYEYEQYLDRMEADRNTKEAGRLSTGDRRGAALPALEAQERNASARALRPYLNFFRIDLPRSLDQSLDQNAARELSGFGFDTLWAVPTKNSDPMRPMWLRTEQYVATERSKVVQLSGAVLIFVIALALFTFAQLSLKTPIFKNLFAWSGVAVASIGLTVALFSDGNSWKSLLIAISAFLSIVMFGLLAPAGKRLWRSMRLPPLEEAEPIHPGELDPLLFAGMRMHMAPVAHGFGRFLIFMIAVTAVLSASSGLLYSRATTRSAAAFSEAIENQGILFKTSSRSDATLFNKIGDLSTEQQYLIHYEAATQRSALAKQNSSLLDLTSAISEQSRWKARLDGLNVHNKSLEKTFRGEMGPDHDPRFPEKLASQGMRESEEAFALSDANNEISLRWQEKATTYLTILTFFAIALYLFGQALSMGRTRDALLLSTFSCGLVLYSLSYGAYMGWESRTPGHHGANRDCGHADSRGQDAALDAARHYVEGRVLFNGSSGDPEKLAKAAQEFGCAVDVRPAFAMADFYYAISTQLAETPQLKEGAFVSVVPKKYLTDITDHEREALKLIEQQGLKAPASAQAAYGFYSIVEGMLQGKRKIIERGIEETRKAIDLNPTDVGPMFNLGFGLLADGKKEDAIATYQQAMNHVQGRGDFIAGAITDLDTLRRYCGGTVNQEKGCEEITQQTIPSLKSAMVTAAWPPKARAENAATSVEIGGIQLQATAAGFGWRIRKPNSDLDRNAMSVLWYAYNPEWETWRVLPVLSGRASWKPDDSGSIGSFRSVLSTQGRTCAVDGRYRAEFYLNGRLAGSGEITAQHGNFLSAVLPAANLAMCYPASWQIWNASGSDESVFVRGYTGDTGDRGIFLFTYFDLPNRSANDTESHFLHEATSFLRKHKLVALAKGQRVNDCAGQSSYAGDVLTAFEDGPVSAISRVGIEGDGLVHVALAYDKNGSPPNCDSLMSVTRVFVGTY